MDLVRGDELNRLFVSLFKGVFFRFKDFLFFYFCLFCLSLKFFQCFAHPFEFVLLFAFARIEDISEQFSECVEFILEGDTQSASLGIVEVV